MLGPVFAALLLISEGGPGVTDERVIEEPPPRDPVIEPVEITPPPERPRPVEIEAALELEPGADPWDTVVQTLPAPLPPPPPPPDGAGRLVGGSVAIGLGLAAASAVLYEGARADGEPRLVASTFVPLGLASLGVGTYLLVRGARARANFNDWKSFTHARARPTGSGLLVGGTMGVVIGGVTLVAAAVQAREPGAFERPLTPTLFGIGAAGVAFGVAALTWGMLRRNHYQGWRQSTFLGVVPTVAPSRSGVSFGVAGRF
jgi:hypothetical protein